MTQKKQPLQLLIAEDNEADVFLIRECLRAAGLEFEAEIAADGAKALSLVDRYAQSPEEPLHGMVLDLNLLTHSGFDILLRVRSAATLAELPVVILTSSESPEDRRRAELLGTDGYFRKPLDLGEFMKLGREIAEIFRSRSGSGTSA